MILAELCLAQGFGENDGARHGHVKRADLLAHRNNDFFMGIGVNVVRNARAFPAQEQDVVRAEFEACIGHVALGR